MRARPLSTRIVSLSFNDIVPRTGSLLAFVVGSQLAKAKNLQGYIPLARRPVVRFRSVIFATIITKFLNFNVIIEGV